jgi:hypothetical protein
VPPSGKAPNIWNGVEIGGYEWSFSATGANYHFTILNDNRSVRSTFQCTWSFQAPPGELIPGQTITLTGNGSGGGSAKVTGDFPEQPWCQGRYFLDGIRAQIEEFKGVGSQDGKTWTNAATAREVFVVPDSPPDRAVYIGIYTGGMSHTGRIIYHYVWQPPPGGR